MLVHDLAGESPDAFPTGAVAVVDLPGEWAGVRSGIGTLRTVRTPKD
jgi:phosphohistidine phosphatase